MLLGDTLINVREDEQRRIRAFSGEKGPVTELTHEGLDGFHISFTLIDSTREALERENETNQQK